MIGKLTRLCLFATVVLVLVGATPWGQAACECMREGTALVADWLSSRQLEANRPGNPRILVYDREADDLEPVAARDFLEFLREAGPVVVVPVGLGPPLRGRPAWRGGNSLPAETPKVGANHGTHEE